MFLRIKDRGVGSSWFFFVEQSETLRNEGNVRLVLVLSKDMRVDCRSKYNTAILMQAAKEILYISIYFYTFIPLYLYTFIKETVLGIISHSAQNACNVRFQEKNSSEIHVSIDV